MGSIVRLIVVSIVGPIVGFAIVSGLLTFIVGVFGYFIVSLTPLIELPELRDVFHGYAAFINTFLLGVIAGVAMGIMYITLLAPLFASIALQSRSAGSDSSSSIAQKFARIVTFLWMLALSGLGCWGLRQTWVSDYQYIWQW